MVGQEASTDRFTAPSIAETHDLPLLGPADIRALVPLLGHRPTKMLGQNYLHDAGTLRRIVQRSGVGPGDTVLEVGPGLGSLTLALLDSGADVVAVEVDPATARLLPATIRTWRPNASQRFTLVQADAVRLTAQNVQNIDLPGGRLPNRFVANLPYNVAVPILLNVLAELPSVQSGLVMAQSEVVDRLAAGPGNKTYGVPSVKAAWDADVRRDITVNRSVFVPVPNVDSALAAFTRREPPTDQVTRSQVYDVVDAAFGQRRKMLRAALKVWAGSSSVVEEICYDAGIDPTLRGERLGVHEYARLAAAKAARSE